MAAKSRRTSLPPVKKQIQRVAVELRMAQILVQDVDDMVDLVGATRSGFFALAAARLLSDMAGVSGARKKALYQRLREVGGPLGIDA